MGSAEELISINSARNEGLDAWRVALMLGGLVLHASLWQPSQPLFTLIETVSNAFRMGSFFALSGLLSGLALQKRDPGRWLIRRLLQIALPTLFGWGVLCPSVFMIAHWYPGTPTPLIFDWHHIWFMVALLIYAPAALVVLRMNAQNRLICAFAEPTPPSRATLCVLLGVPAISFILMGWTALLTKALAPTFLAPMLSQLPNMVGYFPEYMLGIAVARAPQLGAILRQSSAVAIVVLLAVSCLYVILFAARNVLLAQEAHNLLRMVAASLCPPAVFVLILRTTTGGGARVPPLVRRLCDASLTIYLLHLPLLLIANAALSRLELHPYGQYIAAIISVGTLAYAVHWLLIRRVPILSLLVNGRIDHWRDRHAMRSPSSAPTCDPSVISAAN